MIWTHVTTTASLSWTEYNSSENIELEYNEVTMWPTFNKFPGPNSSPGHSNILRNENDCNVGYLVRSAVLLEPFDILFIFAIDRNAGYLHILKEKWAYDAAMSKYSTSAKRPLSYISNL